MGLTALALWKFRVNTLERAERSLSNFGIILAGQTQRALQSVVLILNTYAPAAQQALHVHDAVADGVLAADLRKSIAGMPQLRALVVYDESGKAVASGGASSNWVTMGDIRPKALYGAGTSQLVIGGALARTGETRDTIPVAYRISAADGQPLGVMVAFLDPSYFTYLYHSLDLGSGGQVMLLNRSGVLLADYPSRPEWAGRSFADSVSSVLALSGAGPVVRHLGAPDGEPRVTAIHEIDGYPLIVAVSMTEHHILGPWRATAQQFGTGAFGAALLAMALMLLIARQLHIAEAARAELRQSAQRLDGIIQSAMDAIITVNQQQRILLFNAAAEQVFRCSAAKAIGSSLDRFLPERFRAVHRAHVDDFGATGVTARRMGDRVTLTAMRADGQEFPIDASISKVVVNDEKVYTVILRDITEQRRAEKEIAHSHHRLRELAIVMNDVREAERTRVARELHDELAQWLTALKMDVSWLASRLPSGSSEMAARTARMSGIIDDTVKAVRRIAADLRPTILDDLGPIAALEWLAQDFSERSGLAVKTDMTQAEPTFQEPLVTAVFRMVQEALTNVARHARATEVVITLQVDDTTLRLCVRDNGNGADLALLEQSGSYGLLGIRERAYTLGGTAEFSSAPGTGFSVEIEIPVVPYRGESAAA
jgi:PAS domain S-box-containing protein